MKGRKPKPTALKILEGNPGRRPLPANEPKAARKLPRPPADMLPEHKRLWFRLGKMLLRCGIATQLDGVAFGLLIGAMVDFQAASASVAEFGAVWMEKGEGKIPKFQHSPYLRLQDRARDTIIKLLAEFGMTPSARSRVMSAGGGEQPDNPLVSLMKTREAKRKPG